MGTRGAQYPKTAVSGRPGSEDLGRGRRMLGLRGLDAAADSAAIASFAELAGCRRHVLFTHIGGDFVEQDCCKRCNCGSS
jgi:hypothetical protein